MKKCIIVPDSYKGTLSAMEFCEIARKRVMLHFPQCRVISIPTADGGEGTVDCFLYSLKAHKVLVDCQGPFGEAVKTYYGRFGDTAIIEMAAAAGFSLARGRADLYRASTYGVGMIIRHAIENGCKEIILGLGGSCTNDGGVGMARALGTRFFKEDGTQFEPGSNEFYKIKKIDNTVTIGFLKKCRITAICDIDNPFCGQEGAACVFGPQKGADQAMVQVLDHNMSALADAVRKNLGKEIEMLPGSGAAGGMGGGVAAFLNGRLKSGIQTILDLVGFDSLLEGTDMIFTGEGKLDGQSLRGKVVIGVAERAKKKSVPVTAIVGAVGENAGKAYERGVSAIFSINQKPMDFSEARFYTKVNLERTMDSILRFYKAVIMGRIH